MNRPKFMADHDLNEHIVTGVVRCAPSCEFLRVREVGLEERPDTEILDYADRHGFLIVSHDVNTMPAAAYARIAEGRTIAGLLYGSANLSR